MCTPERGMPHEYEQILEQRRQVNQDRHLGHLLGGSHDGRAAIVDQLDHAPDVLLNPTLTAGRFQAECELLTKVNNRTYEPTIFIGTHSIETTDLLRLRFVGHVLSKVQGYPPTVGRIVSIDGKSSQIKLHEANETLMSVLDPLQKWAVNDSIPEEPAVLLNKHCASCQFRIQCEPKAIREDSISLLSGVTSKTIKLYEKRGIFTVKQLSYLYKPTKRKERKKKPPAKHRLELQALAIRTQKIYLQEKPEFPRQRVELFLDIEGVPDEGFYYLIGLLICDGSTTSYCSFWADTAEAEASIWQGLVDMVGQYQGAPIYHYGSYEQRAIARLTTKYRTGDESIRHRMINVNTFIFGKVYFPLRSNALKEIGKFIGATWTSPQASGLQSLVWRYYWDKTKDPQYRDLLVTYNQEDCWALKLLTDELSRINHSANVLSEVDFVNQPKHQATEVGKQVHSHFENILRFARTDYHKRKAISFQQLTDAVRSDVPEERARTLAIKRKLRPTRIIDLEPPKYCRRCKETLVRPCTRVSRRVIIDLIMTTNGIKKAIIEYRGIQGYCPVCYRYTRAPGILPFERKQMYGHGLKAWAVYQRVALRLSYESIAEISQEQFNEPLRVSCIPNFVRDLAAFYAESGKTITQHLLESPFIHADETPINIRGINQYVWVFTDGSNVAFRLTETRESNIAHEFLAGYTGVLISDFYPGYDSVRCEQQKCWVHLIRDLNEDLWSAPLDTEFEAFVLQVRDLIIPIMEAIRKYGLKHRHLEKYRTRVDKFYNDVVDKIIYKSELAIKYQKRFIRYRNSLFVFLDQDGIPWNNNTAETAIRHLTMQEKISGSFYESVTRDYLVLLGIRQTCRFQHKSFFRFLFSKETDIDKFAVRKRK